MNESRGKSVERGSVRGVFVFALLAMFAMLSLLVVIIGARAYKGINAASDAAYAQACAHFSVAQIAELALAVAEINAWNRLMKAAGTPPVSATPSRRD